MSFGFSVGDFLAVGTLAWTVYRSCKGLTEEFHEVSREALTVHTLINELQDEARDEQSQLNLRGVPRKQELMLLVANLKETLRELDAVVKKYQGLARRERRIWIQLRLATEDLDTIRNKLTFHVTAINAFTASLSRGALAQIETVLLELVSEVRQGRRPPSIASIPGANDDSVWRELEAELAEDGISGADVAKNKAAIRAFVQGLLDDSTADNISLVEVASLMENMNEGMGAESRGYVPQRTYGTGLPPEGANRYATSSSVGDDCSISTESEQYESAEEQISEELSAATAIISLADNQPRAGGELERGRRFSETHASGKENARQAALRIGIEAGVVGNAQSKAAVKARSNSTYTQNIPKSNVPVTRADLSERLSGPPQRCLTGADPTTGTFENSPQRSQMILIIDPYHSCVSRLAHAYLQSLITNNGIVKDRIDTVKSFGWRVHEGADPDRIGTIKSLGWRVHEGAGSETLLMNKQMNELLLRKRLPVPDWEPEYRWREFAFQDMLVSDHIIYINSPSFPRYLKDNVDRIAILGSRADAKEMAVAKLTRYDRPSTVRITAALSAHSNPLHESLRNIQRLELQEILKDVQRFILDFLEREFGLNKTRQGFEKMPLGKPV